MYTQSKSNTSLKDSQSDVQQAESNAINCLLNCYLREFAIIRNEVNFDDLLLDCPRALSHGIVTGQQKVRISFPESAAELLLVADRVSLLGRVQFSSPFYLKKEGLPWLAYSVKELNKFILQHLACITQHPFNHELMAQINNSIKVTQAFLQHLDMQSDSTHHSDMNFAAKSLMMSEQSLIWGHAMHPTPKSRDGVAFDDMLACSPELQTQFPLYWFEVDPSLIKQLYCAEVKPMAWVDAIKPGKDCLYPCHPWEVKTILAQPLIQQAITLGLITPLGEMGTHVYPTSSVRTTYSPEINQFMKFSIHVRLTNCVRKNAWYELESAVALSQVLKPIAREASVYCPHFSLMLEPGASTLDLSSLADKTLIKIEKNHLKMVSECFGILYREGISLQHLERYSPQMAGALFAWDNQGNSVCEAKLIAIAEHRQQSYQQTVVQWFSAYARVLLSGIFHFFFKHGVAFEPHLQNTVIGFEHDMPAYVWLRDLEGTKLLPEFWPENMLLSLSEEAKSSIYYSREQGWNRIAYCSLINNISEAMFHLSAGDQSLEAELWQVLSNVVEQWQRVEGQEPELIGFLAGDKIPSKNNLSTRLFMKADRLSSYTQLTNPLENLKDKQNTLLSKRIDTPKQLDTVQSIVRFGAHHA